MAVITRVATVIEFILIRIGNRSGDGRLTDLRHDDYDPARPQQSFRLWFQVFLARDPDFIMSMISTL